MARKEIQGEDATIGGAEGDEGCAVCFACCGGMIRCFASFRRRGCVGIRRLFSSLGVMESCGKSLSTKCVVRGARMVGKCMVDYVYLRLGWC